MDRLNCDREESGGLLSCGNPQFVHFCTHEEDVGVVCPGNIGCDIIMLVQNVMIQPLLADRNECADSPCHVSASCINTIGSFHCICNDGFSGDGFECKGSTIHLG